MIELTELTKSIARKSLTLLVLGSLSGVANATYLEAKDKVAESSKKQGKVEKITDKRHPDFVRCRTESIVGSLARKRKICMTNKEWTEARKRGQRLANDMVGAIQGMSGGSTFSTGK